MRILKVTVLSLLLVLPLWADDKPPIDGMDPGTGWQQCVQCEVGPDGATCGGEPTIGAGWMNCKPGWLWLCDGYAGCRLVAECGQRCAIA